MYSVTSDMLCDLKKFTDDNNIVQYCSLMDFILNIILEKGELTG